MPTDLFPDEQLSRVNGQYQLQALTNVPGPSVVAQPGTHSTIIASTRDSLSGGLGGGTLIAQVPPQLTVLDWLTVTLVNWTQAIQDSTIADALGKPWTKYFKAVEPVHGCRPATR